jgi:D-alanyl-D-alanine carboxypeptidase (penicillin-binding protein 5/6)
MRQLAMPASAIVAMLAIVVLAASAAARDADSSDASATGASAAARIERQLDAAAGTAITETYPPPKVTARGWLVHDAAADEPIAAVEASTPRPIASLVKLMTALVVLDRVTPDQLVTIPASVNDLGADAARMDARPGEKWPASDLLDAMLVHSANDAALALASHVGKGSEAAFVELMNERADDLGLSGTTFASSTGLDTPGTASTSTPIDLVALATEALAEPSIAAAVAKKSVTLTRPNGTKLAPLPNRNPLLGSYDGVDGVKTGFTDAAGYMLVTHHVDDATDGELLVVTMASKDEQSRIADSRALLDWARPLRQQLRIVEGGTPLGSIPVQRSNERVEVFACDDLVASVRVGQQVEQQVVLPRSVAAPVEVGDELGELRVRVGAGVSDAEADGGADENEDGDETLVPATVPLCADSSVAASDRFERAIDYARDWRSAWELGVDEVQDAWASVREQAA